MARRVANGTWRTVTPRVLASTGDLRLTPVVRDRAAQLSVPGSVLAGLSVVRAWGLEVPDSPPHLIVSRRVRTAPFTARITRAVLGSREIGRAPTGAPSTTRERAVFDGLLTLDPVRGLNLLERALQQRWTTIDALTERLHAHAGRHGMTQLIRLIASVATGTRSAAERLAARLLATAGVTGWVANLEIRDGDGVIGIGDLVFPTARLVVELDGYAFHVSPAQFQRDRSRQNRLVRAGWTVLRFTWRDLTQRPDYVVASIRALLDPR